MTPWLFSLFCFCTFCYSRVLFIPLFIQKKKKCFIHSRFERTEFGVRSYGSLTDNDKSKLTVYVDNTNFDIAGSPDLHGFCKGLWVNLHVFVGYYVNKQIPKETQWIMSNIWIPFADIVICYPWYSNSYHKWIKMIRQPEVDNMKYNVFWERKFCSKRNLHF